MDGKAIFIAMNKSADADTLCSEIPQYSYMDCLRGPQGTIWWFVVGSNYKNPWRTTHFGCEWMERQSSLQPSNRASPVPYGASTSICIAPMDRWVRRRQYDAALWSITPKSHGERPLLVVNCGVFSRMVRLQRLVWWTSCPWWMSQPGFISWITRAGIFPCSLHHCTSFL